MRNTYLVSVLSVAIATMAGGCGVIQAQREAHQQELAKFGTRVDKASIFVTQTGPNPGKTFEKLGDVKYDLPFSPDAIDSAQQKQTLKNMAYEKWPDNIDAVVNWRSELSDDGNQVSVSGEAIQYESSADRSARRKMSEGLVASPN
ncbi:MAG: hypothetical protein ACREQB_13500 [Candidatus Binataceae bacterium]